MPRPHTAAAAVATLALTGLAACAATGVDPEEDFVRSATERQIVTIAQAGSLEEVVHATHRVGHALLASVPESENAVVSPACAVIALSMLAEGARGETAAALDTALGAGGQHRTDAVNALLAALQEFEGDPRTVQEDEPPERPLAHVANQVVLDTRVEVEDAFLDALAAGYGAGVTETDLTSATGKAVLDAWVAQNTGGLIGSSAIEPEPLLRLVLQNAVLFSARWQSPFLPESTRARPFEVDGTQVDVEQLGGRGSWPYAELDGWQAVRLPYSEGFHTDVLLPPQGTDPGSIAEETLVALTTALASASPRLVALTMPTLDLDAGILDLHPALESLGLGDLFDDPNLSGMSTAEKLLLNQAFQQAVLTLDEAGTTAAAVTELGMVASSAPDPAQPLELAIDRPYLLTVSHTQTSLTLFLAAVRDPRH
ncbi:MAG: serpin family protein [Cellulomonadaceae bacterium]